MIWSGPIVGAFIVFHMLHLTVGAVLPISEIGPNQPDVRFNVITGFQNPAIAGFYILAMILLCLHLYHGLWSMFQSLGISHPRYTPLLQQRRGYRGHSDRRRQLLHPHRRPGRSA